MKSRATAAALLVPLWGATWFIMQVPCGCRDPTIAPRELFLIMVVVDALVSAAVLSLFFAKTP